MMRLKRREGVLWPESEGLNGGFDVRAFAKLASTESGNFWFRSRNHLILWSLRRYFPKAKSFFEVGCGTGFVLSGIEQAFPHLLLVGADIYSDGFRYARERLKKAKLFQMDARSFSLKRQFDLIGAFDALEHITEDALVLSEMHSALKTGGGIIITVPQHKFMWRDIDRFSYHVRRYNARELKNKVEDAGFTVKDAVSFVSLLFPLLIIARMKKQKLSQEKTIVSRELRLPCFLNLMLEKILDFERFLIRLGIRFPFGGSLLIVAYKD